MPPTKTYAECLYFACQLADSGRPNSISRREASCWFFICVKTFISLSTSRRPRRRVCSQREEVFGDVFRLTCGIFFTQLRNLLFSLYVFGGVPHILSKHIITTMMREHSSFVSKTTTTTTHYQQQQREEHI